MRTLILSLGMLSLAACSGSTGLTEPSPYMNVTGAWNVSATVTGGSQYPNGLQLTATLVLVQNGNDVSGSFSIQGGGAGSITGSLNNSAVVLSATQSPPCAGSFAFVGTVSASYAVLTGTLNGSNCHGTVESQFTAVKQ